MPEFDRSQQLHAVTTTADIAHGLQAATADPLWFLAMQWLTMGMLLSLPMIAAGAIIMFFSYKSDLNRRKG